MNAGHDTAMTSGLAPLPLALLVVAVTAATAGAVALGRLRRRGDRWPRVRTLCGAGAVCCLLTAALLHARGVPAGFTGHTVTHLLVGMVAPLLLALAAPVTLALRTLPPPARRALLAALHSRPARVLASPPVALVLDVGALWVLYRTGLHAHLHHAPLLDVVVHGHMLLAGTLFAVVVAGRDPLAVRSSTAARLVLLVVAAAAHDVLATTLYAQGLGGAPGPTPDVQRGAELMRGVGLLVDLGLAAAVMTAWYARGTRELARERRRVGAVP